MLSVVLIESTFYNVGFLFSHPDADKNVVNLFFEPKISRSAPATDFTYESSS